MARNGSGVYSLPAGSTVANGDTSDATDINTPLTDIETDLNTARPIVAGGTGATSASAARTNLGLGDAAVKGVTGADSDAVTGTAGSSGDLATWNGDGDIVGGTRLGMDFIASTDLNNDSSVAFTGFDSSKYDAYIFEFANVTPSIDGATLRMRTSDTGGTPYDATAGNYAWAYNWLSFETSPTAAQFGDDSDTEIEMAISVGSDTQEDGVSGTLKFHGPHLVKQTQVTFQFTYENATGVYVAVNGAGVRRGSQEATNAVAFSFSTGALESGTITMYGLRNA